MTDEFVQYAQQGVYASTEGNMLRMWGEFGEYGEDQVHPMGISFHWLDSWDDLTPAESERPRIAALESLAELADAADVPLVWFGEHGISWRTGTGSVEIGEIEHRGDGTFDADLEVVDIAALEGKIQALFGTDETSKGASKAKNKTVNSFQTYTRQYLPTGYVIQDFDVLVERAPGDPAALVEIKRANSAPEYWTPYANDWPNYYLQVNLADEAGVEPLLIQHEKSFVDGRRVGFYTDLARPANPNTNSDGAFLDWEKELVSGNEARTRLRTCTFD